MYVCMYIYTYIYQNDNYPTRPTELTILGYPRACSTCQLDLPGLDRPTSIDFGASTDPERPTSIDLGASTYPERPTSIDFGSILHSIFDVVRGNIVRAPRCAARSAEPSFLLAGAVLWRVRRRGDNAEDRPSSSKNRPDDGSRTSSAYDLWRLSLLGATWCRFWSPRRTSGRSWPLPAHKLDRSWPPGPTPIDRLRSTWVPR